MIVPTLLVALFATVVVAEIDTLKELYNTIDTGFNKRVGFLSLGNYQAVKNTLPTSTVPVVVGSVDQLSGLIRNGSLVAGLLTQVPPSGFVQFSSGIISPQAMFFAPNGSTLLTRAINAAIVRVIENGLTYQIARNNEPFEVIEANSCYPSGSYYSFPTPSEVAAEPWFQRGYIRVASLASVDWDNTGNYLVDPPTGFWPEYYNAISAQLVAYYGGNFQGLKRTYYSSSNSVIGSVLGNSADVTEPYFVVNGLYKNKPRTSVLSPSCFVLASGSTFYTKKDDPTSDPVLSDGAIAGITVGGVALALGTIFLTFIIYKERKGQPLFMPLQDHEDEDNDSGRRSNSSITSIKERDVRIIVHEEDNNVNGISL